jgi:hypothetical protein
MAADDQNMNEPAMATVVKPTVVKPKPTVRKRGASRTRRVAARAEPAQARSLARSFGGKAGGLARRGKRLVDEADGWVDDARGAAPRIAANMHLPSARRIGSFAEANPVLLGAVGLGIGVIIGALLPRSSFHAGLQGLGLASASPPASSRSRKTTNARPRKSDGRPGDWE